MEMISRTFLLPLVFDGLVSHSQYYILILRNFSLFNYLSVNIDITEWFLVPYIFVYLLFTTLRELDKEEERLLEMPPKNLYYLPLFFFLMGSWKEGDGLVAAIW